MLPVPPPIGAFCLPPGRGVLPFTELTSPALGGVLLLRLPGRVAKRRVLSAFDFEALRLGVMGLLLSRYMETSRGRRLLSTAMACPRLRPTNLEMPDGHGALGLFHYDLVGPPVESESIVHYLDLLFDT